MNEDFDDFPDDKLSNEKKPRKKRERSSPSSSKETPKKKADRKTVADKEADATKEHNAETPEHTSEKKTRPRKKRERGSSSSSKETPKKKADRKTVADKEADAAKEHKVEVPIEELAFAVRDGTIQKKVVASVYDLAMDPLISSHVLPSVVMMPIPQTTTIMDQDLSLFTQNEKKVTESENLQDDQVSQAISAPTKASSSIDVDANLQHKKNTVGILVSIPVPFQKVAYYRGSDRHPITLIKKYVKAILPEIFSEEEIQKIREQGEPTKEQWEKIGQRLQIVLAVNLKNNFKQPEEEIVKDMQTMSNWVDKLNTILKEKGYPASLLKVMWLPNNPQSESILTTPDEINQARTFVNRLRDYVQPQTDLVDHSIMSDTISAPSEQFAPYKPQVEEKKKFKVDPEKAKGKNTRYPFATVRTFAVQHTETQQAINHLAQNNEEVMLLTGDADLVHLHPGKKPSSVLKVYLDELKKYHAEEWKTFATRLGGAYQFEPNEIVSHFQPFKENGALSDESINKSVLATYLAKTMDTAVRVLVDNFGAAYFAEPNTMMTMRLFNADEFKTGNANNKRPLIAVTLNPNLGGNPDWTQKITEQLRQGKNWQSKEMKERQTEQLFLPEIEAQLASSSRHDLIILPKDGGEYDKASKVKKFFSGDQKHTDQFKFEGGDEKSKKTFMERYKYHKKTQIFSPKDNALAKLAGFEIQHNNQITASQLNARFKEAGKGDRVIHALVDILHQKIPYTASIWSDDYPTRVKGASAKKKAIRKEVSGIVKDIETLDLAKREDGAMDNLQGHMDKMSANPSEIIQSLYNSEFIEALRKSIETEIDRYLTSIDEKSEETKKGKKQKSEGTTEDEKQESETTAEDEKPKKAPKPFTVGFIKELKDKQRKAELVNMLVNMELLYRWGTSIMDYVQNLAPEKVPNFQAAYTGQAREKISTNVYDDGQFQLFEKKSKELNTTDTHNHSSHDPTAHGGADQSDRKLPPKDDNRPSDSKTKDPQGGNPSTTHTHSSTNIKTNKWYEEADISAYIETIIVHELGGFKQRTDINSSTPLHHHFLLKERFGENKDTLVAVTRAVRAYDDTPQLKLPIDYFLNKKKQPGHLIADHLTKLFEKPGILNLWHDQKYDEAKEDVKKFFGVTDETTAKRLWSELETINFKVEKLPNRLAELRRYENRRDVFDELMPELLQGPTGKAKIIFSYNDSNAHWLTAEIIINRTGDNYTIDVYAHDPLGKGMMKAEDFNVIQKSINERILAFHPKPTGTITSKESPYEKTRQHDRDSCGVISAEETVLRIHDQPLDSVQYKPGALELREKHINKMQQYHLPDNPLRTAFEARNIRNPAVSFNKSVPEEKQYYGYASIFDLVERGKLDDIMAYFFTEKINWEGYNKNGETILHVAAKSEGSNKLAFLLEKLPESKMMECLDARDNFGNTALHTAIQHGNLLAVGQLRFYGADDNAENFAGLTPAECAKQMKWEAEFLNSKNLSLDTQKMGQTTSSQVKDDIPSHWTPQPTKPHSTASEPATPNLTNTQPQLNDLSTPPQQVDESRAQHNFFGHSKR